MIHCIKKYDTKDKLYDLICSKKYGVIISFFLIAVLSTLPLMSNDYITSNDMTFHMYRIAEITENLRHGILLPSVQSNNIFGYGYLVDIFYPSLFLYPAALLGLCGINPLLGLKITFFLCNLFTPIVSYKSACSSVSNKKFCFYFAVMYSLFPYRILNALVNGFLGEFIATTFLPLVFFGCYKIIKEKKWTMLAWGMIGLLYSHLITLLLAACYVFLFFFVFHAKETFKKIDNILCLIKAAFISILCGLAFLAPFIDVSFSDSFKYDYNAGQSGIVPLNIFVFFEVPCVVAIIFQCILIIALTKFRKFLLRKTDNVLLTNSVCITIFLCIMLTDLFPWDLLEYIPYIKNIQFSTRIMPFASIFMALIVVDSVLAMKDFNVVFIAAFLSVCLTIVLIPSSRECRFIDLSPLEDVEDYEQGSFLDVVAAEYVPYEFSINDVDLIEIDILDLFAAKAPSMTNDDATCSYSRKNNETRITLFSDKPTDMLLGLTYYKYYNVYLNDTPIPFYEQDGRILLKDLTSGDIIVRYEVSLLQKTTALFSSCVVGLFLLFQLYDKKNKSSA